MSIALMTAAFKTALPSTQKFVLVALCDSANDQGECYPSVRLVAEKCSLGERTVQEAISALEGGGYVRREFRNGRSTVYWLSTTPATAAPRSSRTPAAAAPTPAVPAPQPPQIARPTPAAAAPITIIETSIEPSGKRKKAHKALDELLIGIDPQVVSDWTELRKAKRAAVTATAVAGIQREAESAGMTLGGALAICCERGWAGFKADWMKDRGGGKQSGLEARNRAVVDLFKGAI